MTIQAIAEKQKCEVCGLVKEWSKKELRTMTHDPEKSICAIHKRKLRWGPRDKKRARGQKS